MLLGSIAFAAAVALIGRGPDRDPLRILCDVALRPAMERARGQFHVNAGVRIEVIYDEPGRLLAALRATPRGDLLIVTDDEFAHEAARSDLGGEVVGLATARPVIAVPRGNPAGIRGLADLLNPDHRIGVADPEQTAIGRAGRRTLGDGWNRLAERCAEPAGDTVELAQDIIRGVVDATLLWDFTVTHAAGELQAVADPALDGADVRIAAIQLRSARRADLAGHFLAFLRDSSGGGEILRRQGLRPL